MREQLIVAALVLVSACGDDEAKAVAIADQTRCSALVKAISVNRGVMIRVSNRLKGATEAAERAELSKQNKVPHPELDTGEYYGAEREWMQDVGAAQAACEGARTMHEYIVGIASSIQEPSMHTGERDDKIPCFHTSFIGLPRVSRSEDQSESWREQLATMQATEGRYADACKKKFGVDH